LVSCFGSWGSRKLQTAGLKAAITFALRTPEDLVGLLRNKSAQHLPQVLLLLIKKQDDLRFLQNPTSSKEFDFASAVLLDSQLEQTPAVPLHPGTGG